MGLSVLTNKKGKMLRRNGTGLLQGTNASPLCRTVPCRAVPCHAVLCWGGLGTAWLPLGSVPQGLRKCTVGSAPSAGAGVLRPYTVVSYSSSSWEVPMVRYCRRGVAGDEYSSARMVLRSRRSMK